MTQTFKLFLICIIWILAYAKFPNEKNINSRIVGGWYAYSGQFPYQVSLGISNKHFCGGAILNRRWVVTAAHCVEGKNPTDIGVTVGTVNWEIGGIGYGVNRTIIHPNWNASTLTADIALVGTVLEMDLKDGVGTVQLSADNTGSDVGVTFSGWGLTSYPGSTSYILQFIFLKTISNSECKSKLSSIAIDDSHLCTFTKKGEGLCHGDSGGPLINSGNQHLVGIASWGRISCADGYPDLYTRISSYRDWIISQIQ